MLFTGFFNKKDKILSFNPSTALGSESLLLNGNIYNYFLVLKKFKLDGKVGSEEQLLLKLLSEKGFSSLNFFNAEYAFAYLKNHKLFLLRDLFGTKPVYYLNDKDCFRFSDEPFEISNHLNKGVLLEFDTKKSDLIMHPETVLKANNMISSFDASVELFAKELFRSISSKLYMLSNFVLFDNGSAESEILKKVSNDLNLNFSSFSGSFDKACTHALNEGVSVIVSSFGLRNLLINDLSFNLSPEYSSAKKCRAMVRYPFLDEALMQIILNIKEDLRKSVVKTVAESLLDGF